ncbi:MAG: hypothetical protein CL670_14115 [Balneola sp.]|jgi:hypothetical protein|nr:hypothetical protein [Balneola sp.]MBE80289.1 hypothetical protein [Balneola sp.]|tara:strand:- start:329 stop:1528 length:1200 start_codon:yes stop_codon:yes gene_type:complete
MKSTFRITSLSLLLSFLVSITALSQVAITAVPFLQINTDTRSRGLGEATVAMLNSPGGIHVNPATIGRKNTIEFYSPVSFNNGREIFRKPWLPGFGASDLYLQNPGIIFGFDKFSLGYQYTYLNLGEQFITGDSSPTPKDSFNSFEEVHTFSASYQITNDLFVGAGLNFGKSKLSSGQSINGQQIKSPTFTTVDVGIYADHTYDYKEMLITPSLGWSLTDFGKPIGYVREQGKNPLPMMMRGGLGLKMETKERIWDRTAFSIGGYASLSKTMARYKTEVAAGNTQFEPMGPWEVLFKSWGPYQRFNGQDYVELSLLDQLQTQTGLELIYLETLSLRFGHYYEHPENGARSYSTFGIGVHYKYFTLDYCEIDINDADHPFSGTSSMQFKVNIPFSLFEDL